MTSTALAYQEIALNLDGVDYFIAADLSAEQQTHREGYEHFGFRGSREESEVTFDIEGFSAFLGHNQNGSEIEDRSLLRKIRVALREYVQGRNFARWFDFN